MAKRGKKPSRSLLPDKRNAPKKTGKRMKPPLDPADDFETPVKNEPSGKDAAAGERESDQPELLEVRQEPKPTVVNGRAETMYLKPLFSKAPKSGDKLISLQLSLTLTEEHKADGLLPRDVMDAWKFIAKRGRKRVDLSGIPPQTVYFYTTDVEKDEVFKAVGASIVNASLAVVQKKGDGEAIKVTRFSYRVQMPFSRETAKFAESNYGNKFWIELAQTEASLLEEEGEDDSEE